MWSGYVDENARCHDRSSIILGDTEHATIPSGSPILTNALFYGVHYQLQERN